MKKPLIFLLFLGAAPLFSLAQRSDIYITGDKVTGNDYMNQSATSISSSWEQTSAAEESYSIQSPVQSSMKRDIDEYNRRYSSSNQASEIAYSDDISQNSAVWVDTVYILENDAEAYAEGYSDASMDYEYDHRHSWQSSKSHLRSIHFTSCIDSISSCIILFCIIQTS